MQELANQKTPSSLVQIINEVDAMPENEQRRLWMQLNKEELLQEARKLDEAITPSRLTEDEILELCQSIRKEQHGV